MRRELRLEPLVDFFYSRRSENGWLAIRSNLVARISRRLSEKFLAAAIRLPSAHSLWWTGGAEKLYRKLRRRLQLGRLFGRHFGSVARSDDDYVRRLPPPLRAEINQRSGELRAFLDSLCSCDADISARYGRAAMKQVRAARAPHSTWNLSLINLAN